MAKQKLKTHKGTVKRYRKTNPKDKSKTKLMHRRQSRGAGHLQTKKSSSRRNRLKSMKSLKSSTQRKKILKMLNG